MRLRRAPWRAKVEARMPSPSMPWLRVWVLVEATEYVNLSIATASTSTSARCSASKVLRMSRVLCPICCRTVRALCDGPGFCPSTAASCHELRYGLPLSRFRPFRCIGAPSTTLGAGRPLPSVSPASGHACKRIEELEMSGSFPHPRARSTASSTGGLKVHGCPRWSAVCACCRSSPRDNAPRWARLSWRCRPQLPARHSVPACSTRWEHWFLQRYAEGGNDYWLVCPRCVWLLSSCCPSMGPDRAGQPVIARLCEEIRLPLQNIVVRDGRYIVYVAKGHAADTAGPARCAWARGCSAHATLLGRILLADPSLPELRDLYPEEQLEAPSAQYAPRTVIELFDLVQSDRERGHVAGGASRKLDLHHRRARARSQRPSHVRSRWVRPGLGPDRPRAPDGAGAASAVATGTVGAAQLPAASVQTQTQVLSITSLNSRRAGGGHVLISPPT